MKPRSLIVPLICSSFCLRRSLADLCGEKCVEEWPNCVNFFKDRGRDDACDICEKSLNDENSNLVRRGECSVGCELTDKMRDECLTPTPCGPSCEAEWPNCVNFFKEKGRDDGCKICAGMLDDENSNLVRRGNCVVGCEVTDKMNLECDDDCGSVAERPAVPTRCDSNNKGCCQCGTGDITTYVFWPAGTDGLPGKHQRCIHTYIPSGGSDLPVLVIVSGYNQGLFGSNSEAVKKAEHYGYALFGIGSTEGPGWGLEFPNDGIVNPENSTPCSPSDSREHGYIEGMFNLIDSMSVLEASKVFLQGFSANSMFAAYMGVCFANRVRGIWQGGSGLAKAGYTPVTPGYQAQCTRADFENYGDQCCKTHFCTECAWWPVYPRTCEHKIIDCVMSYTNDRIGCGGDWYMYEAMVAEGNDARLLSFSPSDGIDGGHKGPQNQYDWIVGCLGIVESCAKECEDSFISCKEGGESYTTCFNNMKIGNLADCAAPCAPTLEMLKMSEDPVVTLSQGNFGTQVGLDSPGGNPAPKPECSTPFGKFSEVGYTKCTGVATPLGPIEECTTSSQPPSVSPSSDPSSKCTEKNSDKFFWKIRKKDNKALKKSCKWLKNYSKKKLICARNVDYGANYGPAQAVCRVTCASCSTCYENENSKFFFKTKNKVDVYKTCKYLAGLSKKKIERFCRKTEEKGGYGSPKGACPTTCKVGVCGIS